MEPEHSRSWKLEFARSAKWRREQELFARDADERRKDRQDADRLEDDFLEFAASAILATADDIEHLRMTLDHYDAATVEALLDNERQLTEVRQQIDVMLGRAYVLPDGRRVFKTEDGLRVFDEHGLELSADDIDPNAIEDWRPRYEGYAEKVEREFELLKEREGLIDYQARVDEARERLDEDGLTKADLADIEADLEASMPLAVQRKLPGFVEPTIPAAARDFGAAAGLAPDLADIKLDLPEFGR